MMGRLTRAWSVSSGSLLVTFLLLGAPAGGQTVQWGDDQFVDSAWVHLLRPDSAAGGQAVSRQITADNPSGFQQGVHTWTGGTLGTAHLFLLQTYEPAVRGPIQDIDVGLFFRMTVVQGGVKDSQAAFILRQGGRLYVHGALHAFSQGSAWSSIAAAGATADHFNEVTASGVNASSHPDFTCTGGPIEFGYTVLTPGGKPNGSVTWNADNFSVAVRYAGGSDCNANGVSDTCDIATGASTDCDGNGTPDECQPDCDGDGEADVCEIASGAPDCNANGIPDACDLASGSSTDCNRNAVLDECDLASGEPDCNGNGILDTCDVDPGGRALAAWGWNDGGQLGVPTGEDFIAVTGGAEHGLALRLDGSLAGWGRNDSGQASVPAGNDFQAVAANDYYSLALHADGSIVGWGRDDFGRARPPAGNGFVAISAGVWHGLALRADGSLVAWGDNTYGQCDVPAGSDYVAIAAGGWHNLALRTSGEIVAWGLNNYGQADAPPGIAYVAIDGGYYHSLALQADGTIFAWGANDHGQCNVPAENDFVAIAAGGFYSLGLRTDQTLAGWGENHFDQLNVPAGMRFGAIASGTHTTFALRQPAFLPADCDGNGVPDECELIDCNGNGLHDACDIASGASPDCDANGVPDSCDIDGGAADCNTNNVPDACELAANQDFDCDGNGTLDSCDLADGAPDCNHNAVPDSCELASGAGSDCNENGVLDWCDLAGGTSADCNANAVPDDCEPDADGDQYPDDCDNCPDLASPDQTDRDSDGLGDPCDPDIDGDGTPNEQDACPIDPNKIADIDTDGDGLLDCNDNCPAIPNPDQDDVCRAPPHVLCVRAGAVGAGDGSSWYNAFPALRDALDAVLAAQGQVTEIWIAAGTYKPDQGKNGTPGNRGPAFVLNHGVSLYGGFAGIETAREQAEPAANLTILSGDLLGNDVGDPSDASRNDNSFQLLITTQSTPAAANPVIAGLTITGGGVSRPGSNTVGGGLRTNLKSLIVRDCTFISNGGASGGAVYVDCGEPTFINCTFIGNRSVVSGGALAISTRCLVPVQFVGCSFVRNRAGSAGGAINGLSAGRLMNCQFTGNLAGTGGAIGTTNSTALMANCLFAGNQAAHGGALYYSNPVGSGLFNCTLVGNLAIGGATAISRGGGILLTGQSTHTLSVRNCILWGNADQTGTTSTAQLYTQGSATPAVMFSCVQEGSPVAGPGNIAGHPRFVRHPAPGQDRQWGTTDDDYGDLRLLSGSPCIDAGELGGVPSDFFDLDTDGDTAERLPVDLAGGPRFRDDLTRPDTGAGSPPIVDMGVYEVLPVPGDFDGDADVDAADVEAFTACASGAAVPAGDSCAYADLDADGDADQSDFGSIQRCYSGDGQTQQPLCAN